MGKTKKKKERSSGMEKKISAVKVGPVELHWESYMADPNADLEFIKQQIDGWMFEIENVDNIDSEKLCPILDRFIAIMREFGHVTKLDEDYKKKYLDLLKFQKRECSVSIAVIDPTKYY